MKTKLVLASMISAQLIFSNVALAQTAAVDCGDKLTYANTPAANLVGSYIEAQKERFKELKDLLKEANKLKEEVEKNATTTETVGKISKYIGVVEVIGSLVFSSKTSSVDLIDGIFDIAHGDQLISKAQNLKLRADNNLKDMTMLLINEEKSLHDLIQKHSQQACISQEEYLEFVKSYKKQAVDRISMIEKFVTASKKRVDKIEKQRNLTVGMKAVGAVGALYFLYLGAKLATSKTIGIWGLVGYPMMFGGGVTAVGLGASIYTDINDSKESISQIQALVDNRLKELAQIKSLLGQSK